MQTRHRSILITFGVAIYIVLGAFPTPVEADFSEKGGDFFFLVESLDREFVYPGETRTTRINSLVASWRQNLSPRLRGGLRLSYLDLSQPSNPIPAGMNTTGYGLGFDLHGMVLERETLNTVLRFGYSYQNTRGSSTNQTSELNWHEMEGGIDFTLLPRSTVAILLGASVTYIDGEQRNSGTINQIQPFEQDDPLGYYAGLSIRTDESGRIGVKWYGGFQKGFFLQFSRRY